MTAPQELKQIVSDGLLSFPVTDFDAHGDFDARGYAARLEWLSPFGATALFAAGEGWHNNHHRYQRAARNGFYWWEFDPTWYVIRAMQAVGLAWDVQPVPERIYAEARATKARRRAQKSLSVVQDAGPIGLELVEDVD